MFIYLVRGTEWSFGRLLTLDMATGCAIILRSRVHMTTTLPSSSLVQHRAASQTKLNPQTHCAATSSRGQNPPLVKVN